MTYMIAENVAMRGYAFQWYSLAALILVLYVVLNLHRTEPAPPRQD